MASNNSLVPSAKDLIMVLPRLAQRAGSLALHIPEHVDSAFNKMRSGGSIIADATAVNNSAPSITKSASAVFVQSSATASNATQSASPGMFSWLSQSLGYDGFRLGGMFTYFGSRWALATFAVSIFLNRIHFYASSRQNLQLKWKTRLLLYAAPIALLLAQTLWVLQAMKCQTSRDFALLRYGDSTKNLAINFGGEGGFLHSLSSFLIFWQDDKTSCNAMHMALEGGDKLSVVGSFSLIWPFFVTICISSFVESFSCALQGRQPMPETGMTIFEHSLAFAETEAMISNALGLGSFTSPKGVAETSSDGVSTSADSLLLLTRPMIMRRLNVPSEVLLICFISCLSHLSSSTLAVTGRRQRYRLVNTGIWALCYLTAFLWSFVRILDSPFGGEHELGFLRFPTVCIVGFLPHIMILVGVLVCAFIYSIALVVNAISLPPDVPRDLSLRERFSAAFNNLQANVQFSSSTSLRLNWQEDFYTNLLKVGFNVLTAASEAVYLNEGNRVTVHDKTWLERKRMEELVNFQATANSSLPTGTAQGARLSGDGRPIQSGYATERKAKSGKDGRDSSNTTLGGGVGFTDRRARWELVADLANGILTLFLNITARTTLFVLHKFGIQRPPAWLVRRTRQSEAQKARQFPRAARQGGVRDFYRLDKYGKLARASDANVDVEAETRIRLRAQAGVTSDVASEDALSESLYSWWKSGGWWGEEDSSGDYKPLAEEHDDLTSVISASDAESAASADWETDGQITPTEDNPYPSSDQLLTNDTFDVDRLARLLNPKSAEDKEEAQMLSRHLQSEGAMTRSRYRRRLQQERARILLPHGARNYRDVQKGQEEDEELALEGLILQQREKARQKPEGQSWQTGADGMGAGGPQCVVCQSSPRSILVWPCGCLSVCDDCRVGVATRNFSSCLCCRTTVVAYSRLYVP